MKSLSRYLTHWQKCPITDRQGAVLVLHIEGQQMVPRCGREHLTTLGLIDRHWLRLDPFANMTSLTDNGRNAALKALAAIGDKLTRAPSLVPDDALQTVAEPV